MILLWIFVLAILEPRSVVRGNNKIQGKSFWQLLKDKNLEIKQFLATTNSGHNTNPANGIGATPTTSTEQQDALKRAENIEGEVFFAISAWGKETDNLTPFHRSLCYSVGRTKSNRKPISGKQALHAMKAYDEAKDKGFKYASDE